MSDELVEQSKLKSQREKGGYSLSVLFKARDRTNGLNSLFYS